MSPDLKNVFYAACFLAMMTYASVHTLWNRVDPADLAQVSGKLVEWSTFGSGKPLLRFRLEGHRADFRLDPAHFRKALGREIPKEFREGARVTVTAARRELLAPSIPLLFDVEIVWVRGIKVDEQVLVDPGLLQQIDENDDLVGLLLVVLALGVLAYTLFKWQSSKRRSVR